jgi:tetratricopeptide (TPR) repeat protein
MATWYPSVMTYREWCQAESFLSDIKGSFNQQTNQIRKSIHNQTGIISDQTKSIVATNEQIVLALEDGFNRVSEISEKGFGNVTSAIEAMHSDLNDNLGILIQRIEYQNTILNGILHTLQTPFETQVREFYSKGCLLTEQGILEKAIEYFNKSLELPTGDIFFPSYYQLGRLYLTGKEETINVVNPQKANEYLLIANKYGTGILRTNEVFQSVLADCRFFISQSYYFQMTGSNNASDNELLNNAIKYAEEAVLLNPNLSQGFYHLAKYYSYKNEIDEMLSNLQKAIEIKRDYTFKYDLDKVFDKNKNYILPFLELLKERKRKVVEPKLLKAKSYIEQLEHKNINQSSSLYEQFKTLKSRVQLAEKDFKTQTYFGFDDSEIKLNNSV